MTDEKRAFLGDHEAARRLTDAGVLLACPCCGGKAKNFGGTFIGYAKCDSCGLVICRMDDNGIRALKYEARLAWNTRAPVLTAEEMERLEAQP